MKRHQGSALFLAPRKFYCDAAIILLFVIIFVALIYALICANAPDSAP